MKFILFLLCALSLSCASKRNHKDIFYSGAKPRKSLAIFIHGLNSDERTAWENKDFFLPKAFFEDKKQNEFDVLVVSYDSECNSKTTNLLADEIIYNFKEKYADKYKNIALIGHSYGGIISRQLTLDLKKDNFSTKISSLTLLGTPNYGSRLADLLDIFCHGERINDLAPAKGQSYIEGLNRNWIYELGQFDSPKIPVSAVYEMLPTAYGPFSTTVVEKEAAILYAQKTRSEAKDHFGISKPEGYDDILYSWIFDSITMPEKLPIYAGLTKKQEERLIIINKTISEVPSEKERIKLITNLSKPPIIAETSFKTAAEAMVNGFIYDSNFHGKKPYDPNSRNLELAAELYSKGIQKYSSKDPAFQNSLSIIAQIYQFKGYKKNDLNKIREILSNSPEQGQKIEAAIKSNPSTWQKQFSN